MTKSGMKFALHRVYYDMPDLLEETLKCVDENWNGKGWKWLFIMLLVSDIRLLKSSVVYRIGVFEYENC